MARVGCHGPPADLRRVPIDDNALYRSLFTYNPHAIFLLDLQGVFLDTNPAGERISGYPLTEMRQMTYLDVVAPAAQQRTLAAFQQVAKGAGRKFTSSVRHRDGHIVELDVIAMPVIVEGEVVGVHGMAEDITARNHIAAELMAARQAAEQASEAKSMLLANVSHELRTPLATLLATTELLGDTELDPLQGKFVTTMARAGGRLHRLIENLLDFSRLEAGTLELGRDPFELAAVLDEASRATRVKAADLGVEFRLEVDPDLPRRLTGDPERLTQLLSNLLENALKFTSEGFVELVVELTRRADDELTVTFVVRDSGVGISADQRDLFEPFTQVDPSVTRTFQGVGLGLAICRGLVEQMNGSIDLDSVEGEGTTVSVQVPLLSA